jgi:hypothetical protein
MVQADHEEWLTLKTQNKEALERLKALSQLSTEMPSQDQDL